MKKLIFSTVLVALIIMLLSGITAGAPIAAQTVKDTQKPQKKKEDVKKMTQPYYVVDFYATACNIDIRINDITVLKDEVNGQIGTMVPINNAILKSGPQKISVDLKPLAGQTKLGAGASFEGSVALMNGENFEKISERKFDFLKKKTFEKDAGPQSFKKEYTFAAEVPYSFNTLDQAADLRNVKDLKDLLLKEYNDIFKTVESRDFDKLKKIKQDSENRLSTQMFLNDKEKEERTGELVGHLGMPETKPVPIGKDARVVFYADGKLARLENPDGSNALSFGMDGKEIELEFYFYMPEGSQKLAVF